MGENLGQTMRDNGSSILVELVWPHFFPIVFSLMAGQGYRSCSQDTHTDVYVPCISHFECSSRKQYRSLNSFLKSFMSLEIYDSTEGIMWYQQQDKKDMIHAFKRLNDLLVKEGRDIVQLTMCGCSEIFWNFSSRVKHKWTKIAKVFIFKTHKEICYSAELGGRSHCTFQDKPNCTGMQLFNNTKVCHEQPLGDQLQMRF